MRNEKSTLPEIAKWLAELGLEKYISTFEDAEIDFETLPDLEEDDLKELGLPLGPRRKAWGAIQRLDSIATASDSTPQSETPPKSVTTTDTPSSSDAERRHLTVMFVDLVGSTEMATKLDAEDMRDVITSYQNTVAGVVSRYEGFVAKFMGDGVLCYFGWPRANEDDAERAVRAGLSIIDAVKLTKAPNGTPLSTRVGIATGVVIVGDLIGSGATQEAAVVGETPNLAARLQGVAGLNQLVVAKETQRLLGAIFNLSRLKGQDLKGIAGPIDAYRVEGEATVQSRFAARQSGGMTAIVGREREIELMIERWALTRSGQGQMAIVSGEAGIGKSRITQEVIDEVAKDDHTRITFQCSPYHVDSAFYPVTQQMSFAAGIAPSDSPDLRLKKLEALLEADQDTLRLVSPLLGLDGEARYGALDLTPAQQRAKTMQALAGLLARQAAEKPVLMVFEDLHWIDPTSQELLDTLLARITDQPMMILATARPTFDYGFGGHPIVTKFALNRLGKDQIGAIVAKLTDGKALPDEIMAIIAQRTDGVPLFIEELTKTILESSALKDDGERYVLNGPLRAIAIPTTLHDSLLARLDRLQPIKEVAQTAACIGREFSYRLLSQISPLKDAELTGAMDGLIAAELIYRRGLPPEATYLFKHALVRDAAYESLLKERRRTIHTRILSALETDPDIAPEVLAVHADAANQTDRAVDLWEVASKAAIARPAFDEAISHLGRAISLITPQLETSDTPPYERALALQVSLSMTFLSRKGHAADETLASFEKALGFANKVGETPMRYSILYGLWVSAGTRGQHADALRSAESLVEITANSPNTPQMVVANRVAGASHWFMGNYAQSGRFLDVAFANYDQVAHAGLASQFGQDIGVAAHVFKALNLLTQGQTTLAVAHMDEAENVAGSTGHIQTVCYLLMMRALFSLISGDDSDVERCLNEASPKAHEHNLGLWSAFIPIIGETMAARNGDETSIERYRKAYEQFASTKFTTNLTHLHIDLAQSALLLGHSSYAAELAKLVQVMIDKTGEEVALSSLHRLQAALARLGDDQETAERYLGYALNVARRQGGKLWELRAAIDLAGLWRDQGKTAEAISLLQPVHGSIADGDCPEDCKIANELLTALTAK
ncbi:adenylate/guanylate cyclase domain-containing protein [Shimia sp.]|uniref:AAA family ATPase n=1 Tax=Shimia sp. TaxID=1954381 RepID=UPI003297EBD8